MENQISQSKLCAEQTLAYILNKLRNHDQIIKNLHEQKGDGWRKMKYARGLFDRKVGFLSCNDVNKEFIALIEPFHCKLKTCSEALYNECPDKCELVSEKDIFDNCDIIVLQGDANDYKSHISSDLIQKINDEALLALMSDDISIDSKALIDDLKAERINALVNDKLDFANEVKSLPNVMIAKQYSN